MPHVLVRNVPQDTLEALKKRAEGKRRSLQRELLDILEVSAKETVARDPAELAAAIRRRLGRGGRAFGDSAKAVREDRER